MKADKKFLLICLAFIPLWGLSQQPKTSNPKNFSSIPVVNAGPDLVLVPGQTQVQAQATVDDATASILWNGPVGFSSNILRPWISDLGMYEITATNSFGCSSSDQMELREVNPTDTLFISPPPVCTGEEPIWLFSYTTIMDGSFSGPGVYGYYFYPDSVDVGIHELIWNIDGKTYTTEITILAGPNVWVHQDMLFGCVGQSVTLSAVGQADYYHWTLNTDTISTDQYHSVFVENEPVVYGLVAGKYYQLENKTCYIRDTTTVSQISTGFSYTQETGEGAYGPIFGSNVSFNPDFEYAISYSWNFGNTYVPGGGTSNEMSPTYNYSPYYGYFTVVLTMNSVCGVTTHSEVVRVNSLTTSAESLTSADVSIYPNPTTSLLNISFGDKQISTVIITDVIGRVLVNQKLDNYFDSKYQVDVNNYKPGVYTITLSGKNGGVFSSKFIKQ